MRLACAPFSAKLSLATDEEGRLETSTSTRATCLLAGYGSCGSAGRCDLAGARNRGLTEVNKSPQPSVLEAQPTVSENPPGPTEQAEIRTLPEVGRRRSPGPEPWQTPTRTRLARQLEAVFGQASEERARVPFNADELADEDLQLKLRDLFYQLAVAANVDLRNLEAYGIVLNDNRSIQIDRVAYPRWKGVVEALDRGRDFWLTLPEQALREKGFSAQRTLEPSQPEPTCDAGAVHGAAEAAAPATADPGADLESAGDFPGLLYSQKSGERGRGGERGKYGRGAAPPHDRRRRGRARAIEVGTGRP